MATNWSEDAFLDEIRRHVDDEADACVKRLFSEGGASGSAALFRHVTSNDDRLPEGSGRPGRCRPARTSRASRAASSSG
jgi:hypothetical protein